MAGRRKTRAQRRALARRRAVEYTRALRRIERPGVAVVRAVAEVLRSTAVSQAYARGEPLHRVWAARWDTVRSVLQEAMVVASLRGRLDASAAFHGVRIPARLDFAVGWEPEPYQRAIERLEERLNLDKREREMLANRYGNEAVNVLRRASRRIEEKAQLAIQEIVEQGYHVEAGMELLNGRLASLGLGDRPYLLETLVRTQVSLAYSAGRWEVWQNPEAAEILWGWEYVTVGDDRVRPNHAVLDGKRWPKNDPAWDTVWPPNGFNCRCSAVEIFREEAPPAREVAGAVPPEGMPDPGWDWHTGRVFGRPPARLPSVREITRRLD